MFKKLREKIGDWTKKISEKAEQVEPVVKVEKTEKAPKLSAPETPDKQKDLDSALTTKEISLPVKFDPGRQKYEPDLNALKEIQEEVYEAKKQETKDIPAEDITDLKQRKGLFKKISEKIKKIKISEEDFEVYAEELEMLLIENNVALEVAEKIVKDLKLNIIGKEFLKKELELEIRDSFKEILREILVDPFLISDKIKEKSKETNEPYIILFCGINGTGKTTTIAKIADQLKRNNITSVMAAADTFRAASIEQIKKHGEVLGIPVISNQYESDPASVGFDAIKYAKKHKIQCVLIDTAGRMHTSKNLLKEIEKIARVTKPDLKIFVGESITGNDAVEQVKTFDWEIGIDGIILTKADIDEKGGTALSVGYVTKKPILYLGTGQEYDKIEPFDKEKFIEALGL